MLFNITTPQTNKIWLFIVFYTFFGELFAQKSSYKLVYFGFHKKGFIEYFSKKAPNEWLYTKTATYEEETIKQYPIFFALLDTAITYKKTEALYAKYYKKKPASQYKEQVIFGFEGAGGFKDHKGFIFDLEELKDKDPSLKRVLDFIKAFRAERGCNNFHELYQLKKGETIKSVAKKKKLDPEDLAEFNYENNVGFCTVNTFSAKDFDENRTECTQIKPRAGHFIILPCIPKKPKYANKHKPSAASKLK